MSARKRVLLPGRPVRVVAKRSADLDSFVVGDWAIFIAPAPWWLRLLRWLRLAKRPRPLRIVSIDRERGVLTVDSAVEGGSR